MVKMSVPLNERMSKIMRTPIKVDINACAM